MQVKQVTIVEVEVTADVENGDVEAATLRASQVSRDFLVAEINDTLNSLASYQRIAWLERVAPELAEKAKVLEVEKRAAQFANESDEDDEDESF